MNATHHWLHLGVNVCFLLVVVLLVDDAVEQRLVEVEKLAFEVGALVFLCCLL